MADQHASGIRATLVRFGIYEADFATGELRRNGQPVRLQEQPFQILAALVERPGEVVTRDELRERLWPGESFGDFDQGLNTAINKLREALGDSASNARYIETVPRRGYRFAHPLESVVPDDGAVPVKRALASARYLGVIVALIGATVAVFTLSRPAPDPQLPLRRFTLRALATSTLTPDSRLVAISPNGRYVAIVEGDSKTRLWVQDLERQHPMPIEGTEGAHAPFWSPDSTVIGFSTKGKLKKVGVNGGPVVTICDTEGSYFPGASWSPDGSTIVFTARASSSLYSVASRGGTARLLLSPEMLEPRRGGPIAQPHFVRAENGTTALLFTYFGSRVSLMMLDLKTNRHHVVGTGSHPSYSSTGHLLYRSGKDLWARPFSVKQGAFSGDAFRIARDATDPTTATDGTLAYRDVLNEELVWLDRRGGRVANVELPASGAYYPALSPDRRRVAVETWEHDNLDVWISDMARGARIRVTYHPTSDVVPVWSPDGEELAYNSLRAGNSDIFVRRADAGADEVPTAATELNERVSDWSKDGQYITYSVEHPRTGSDLWYLKRLPGGKWESHAFLETSFNEQSAKFSPDGRYIAYLSDESGRDEAYVREFPSGVRRWPISSRGASQVRWGPSGRELFYSEGGTLMAVPLRSGRKFEAGAPTRLFTHSRLTVWRDPNYDVSADSQRFLLPQTVGGREPMIHVVQNWFAEFRKRQ